MPAVSKAVSPISITGSSTTAVEQNVKPRSTLSLTSTTGVVVAVNEDAGVSSNAGLSQPQLQTSSTGLSFDEEAKLVYGVVISLRNMIRKLSGRDEQFVNYRTSTYKLHVFETVSGYKFVMLSDPNADSLRIVLRQIYVGPFLEYVVRNPLVDMDSKERGIDNEYFRAATDRVVRSLSGYS